ncbi:MAG: tryptophan-rich sensory protein [Clostridiales bacterium]|nr:tryptophan-rich sensory protein [Clostridiales bacterium]
MKRNLIYTILLSFIPVIMVAILGSVFVRLGMDWFSLLVKPSQWIPDEVIPIVWTIIYLLTAIVLFLWLRNGNMPKNVIALFIINGALNVLWCLLFFALQLTFVGVIAIVLNLVMGYCLLVEIKKENMLYFYMLAIYPLWLSIATTLNMAVWILN